ncbi:hypothetical protein AURANDRAFT_28502, partial [Aureococcus anophagefferens]
VGTVLGYVACFSLFTHVLKVIPLGVAYAIWSGAGCALTYAVGVICFGESISRNKILSILVIIAGVVGLELSNGH